MKKKFDKYWHYRHSVQSPDLDVRFIRNCYRSLKKKSGYVFREDFCSTFALSCEWIKLGNLYRASAIDIDDKPLKYGKEHYLAELNDHQKKRMRIIHSNVLSSRIVRADIIATLNFSYFILKKRSELKKYFLNCLKSLNKDGILVLDCFGGSECFQDSEEKMNHGSFIYYWDQKNFDPISHHAIFHIHYKRRGEKKRKNVFSYPWRLWTLPEIKDLLLEAGFRKTHVYWEGTDKNGEGDGRFVRKKRGEDCESWIAYIVSEK